MHKTLRENEMAFITNEEIRQELKKAVKKDCVAAVTILLSSEKITVNQAVFKLL